MCIRDRYTPIPSDTKENQLCSLKPSEIQRCFELTLKALDKALQFIQEHNLQEPDRIDYITYLTGYFVYYPDNMGKEVENKLCEWYMNVNFKNQSNTCLLYTSTESADGIVQSCEEYLQSGR